MPRLPLVRPIAARAPQSPRATPQDFGAGQGLGALGSALQGIGHLAAQIEQRRQAIHDAEQRSLVSRGVAEVGATVELTLQELESDADADPQGFEKRYVQTIDRATTDAAKDLDREYHEALNTRVLGVRTRGLAATRTLSDRRKNANTLANTITAGDTLAKLEAATLDEPLAAEYRAERERLYENAVATGALQPDELARMRLRHEAQIQVDAVLIEGQEIADSVMTDPLLDTEAKRLAEIRKLYTGDLEEEAIRQTKERGREQAAQAAAETLQPGSARYWQLRAQAENPATREAFLALNIDEELGKVTPAEQQELRTLQNAGDKDALETYAQKVNDALAVFKLPTTPEQIRNNAEKGKRTQAFRRVVEAEKNRRQAKLGRRLTSQEIDEVIDLGTEAVVIDKGFFSFETTVPRFGVLPGDVSDVDVFDLPPEQLEFVKEQLALLGKATPTTEEIARAYLKLLRGGSTFGATP